MYTINWLEGEAKRLRTLAQLAIKMYKFATVFSRKNIPYKFVKPNVDNDRQKLEGV